MKKIKEFNLIKIKNLILLLFTRFKWEMIYLTFLTIIAGLLEAINLLILYPVINSGLKQNSKGFIIDLFDQITRLFDPNSIFLFYCYFLIMISFISIGFRAFTYHYSYCILKKISSFYYKEVFTKYNTNDYQFFVKNQQGKLMHTGNAASQSASAMIIDKDSKEIF